jgi:hypothetical protein
MKYYIIATIVIWCCGILHNIDKDDEYLGFQVLVKLGLIIWAMYILGQ